MFTPGWVASPIAGSSASGFSAGMPPNHPPGNQTWVNVTRGWQQTQYGNMVVLRHSETKLQYYSEGDQLLVLIGDAFVAAGELNEDPLGILAGARNEDGFLDALDRLSGRFSLLVIGEHKSMVFHDPLGSRSLFYRAGGANVLGSHAMLVAMACGAPRRQDIQALVASRSYKNMKVELLPGDLTLFEDVYALPPNHYYDNLKRRIVRYWPGHPRRSASFDEFFTAIDNYLRGLAGFLRPPCRPVVGITVGVDSRTLATAFSHYGLEFRGVTWTRLNFQPWEAEAVSRILRLLNIQQDIVDRSNDGINAAACIGVFNSGGYRNPSPGQRPRQDRADKGFLGPRDVSGVCRGGRDRSALDPDFVRTSLSAFEGFWKRCGYYELEQSGYDVNDIFYWEHRVGNWTSASINAMDSAINSLAGFNCRSVLQIAYGLQDNVRLKRELFIEIIRRYDASIAAIPHGPSRMPREFAGLIRVGKDFLLEKICRWHS